MNGHYRLISALIATGTLLVASTISSAIAQQNKVNITPVETVSVPFAGGLHAATTLHTYSGQVWLCVTGVGQAAGPKLSDAFYVYTSESGSILLPPGVIGTDEPHPWHSLLFYNWVLSINHEHAEDFVVPIIPGTNSSVPSYNPTHVYAFPINIPNGPLIFGVGDGGTGDNTGAYTITVGEKADALGCYTADIEKEISDGYDSGAITLPGNSLFAQLNRLKASIRKENYSSAAGQAGALINHIQAQSGKAIDESFATTLIDKINYLLDLLGHGLSKSHCDH